MNLSIRDRRDDVHEIRDDYDHVAGLRREIRWIRTQLVRSTWQRRYYSAATSFANRQLLRILQRVLGLWQQQRSACSRRWQTDWTRVELALTRHTEIRMAKGPLVFQEIWQGGGRVCERLFARYLKFFEVRRNFEIPKIPLGALLQVEKMSWSLMHERNATIPRLHRVPLLNLRLTQDFDWKFSVHLERQDCQGILKIAPKFHTKQCGQRDKVLSSIFGNGRHRMPRQVVHTSLRSGAIR